MEVMGRLRDVGDWRRVRSGRRSCEVWSLTIRQYLRSPVQQTLSRTRLHHNTESFSIRGNKGLFWERYRFGGGSHLGKKDFHLPACPFPSPRCHGGGNDVAKCGGVMSVVIIIDRSGVYWLSPHR